MRLTIGWIFVAAFFCALPATSQTAPDSSWKKLDFLLGKWTGAAAEKDTPHGSGQGDFSFEAELNQKIIVRHNHAAYTSGEKHDDLMIIYLDAPNDAPRAIYFDTEGHVIRYNISFPSAEKAVFDSDGNQPGPRFRLSYWMQDGALLGKFEIAPPGAEYKTYLSWTSKKN